MKGSEEPDVWIVRGNHYDGWVNGADDPISGQSALLEEARALWANLSNKDGGRSGRWSIRPGMVRSQVIEESTEWAETHARRVELNMPRFISTRMKPEEDFWGGITLA